MNRWVRAGFTVTEDGHFESSGSWHTWFQLEKHPGGFRNMLMKGGLFGWFSVIKNVMLHFQDWLYSRRGYNVGPYGYSKNTEEKPIKSLKYKGRQQPS